MVFDFIANSVENSFSFHEQNVSSVSLWLQAVPLRSLDYSIIIHNIHSPGNLFCLFSSSYLFASSDLGSQQLSSPLPSPFFYCSRYIHSL